MPYDSLYPLVFYIIFVACWYNICTRMGSSYFFFMLSFYLVHKSIGSRYYSQLVANRNVRVMSKMCCFLSHNNLRKVLLTFPTF